MPMQSKGLAFSHNLFHAFIVSNLSFCSFRANANARHPFVLHLQLPPSLRLLMPHSLEPFNPVATRFIIFLKHQFASCIPMSIHTNAKRMQKGYSLNTGPSSLQGILCKVKT